jgi:hypothetical protein
MPLAAVTAARGRIQAKALGTKTHLRRFACSLDWSVVATLDLNGEWIGHYPGHFDEVIRIDQNGDEVKAVKITGDDYVPAGAVTWRASLTTLEGEGQIAEKEFQHPRFVPGRLEILNPERLIFRWENFGEVEFRKDD